MMALLMILLLTGVAERNHQNNVFVIISFVAKENEKTHELKKDFKSWCEKINKHLSESSVYLSDGLEPDNYRGKLHKINNQFTLCKVTANYTENIPAKPLKDLKVTEVKIATPSGIVYAVDWFHLDKFTKKLEDNSDDKYGKNSLNYAKGKHNNTVRMAKKNVFSLFVGNSSPSIFKDKLDDGIHYITEHTYAAMKKRKNSKNLGSVCTDLWAVTLVDRDILLKILGGKNDKNIALLDDYLKQHKHVTIPVNSDHLYFYFDYSTKRELDGEHPIKTKFENTNPPNKSIFGILSEKPLTVMNEMKHSIENVSLNTDPKM